MPKTHQRKKHRHFVAAPVAVLILIISMLDSVLPVSSQSLDLSASAMRLSEGEVVSLPRGRAILYSGEGFSVSEGGVSFLGGSALVMSDGLMQFTVAGKELSVLSGALYLSYYGGDITIAALTSPALFRDRLRLMLVPVGMQWRLSAEERLPLLQAGYPLWRAARELHAFPERFLVRQLQNLSALPEEEEVLPPVGGEPLPLWVKLPSLRVGTAREVVEDAWREEVLGALRGLVEAGDRDAVAVFFQDDRYRDVLESEEARQMLIRLLMRQPAGSPLRTLLLSPLVADEDFWLLSSLHPDLREDVWPLFSSHENPEAVTLRLFLLPASNRTKRAVSAEVMRRWVYELSQLAQGDRAVPLVHMVVEQYLPLVSVLEQLGYPERSRVLALSLVQLAESTEVSLPPELASGLQSATSFERVSLEEPPLAEGLPGGEDESGVEGVVEVQREANVQEEPSYSPVVVERRAYTVLRDMGALFTVGTVIEAVAPNTARVRNIVFPAQSGDRVAHFHFNVAKGQVQKIVLGGREYPYALSVEAFRKWVMR